MLTHAIINLARNEASKSGHRFRIGAVVYDKRRYVWGKGYNRADKTHPRSTHPFKTIHAEFDAVLEALWCTGRTNLRGYSIYVHRLLRDNSEALAKPCIYCKFMLDQVGIENINYSE